MSRSQPDGEVGGGAPQTETTACTEPQERGSVIHSGHCKSLSLAAGAVGGGDWGRVKPSGKHPRRCSGLYPEGHGELRKGSKHEREHQAWFQEDLNAGAR